MDQRPIVNSHIIGIVRQFVAHIKRERIPVKQAVLFGSQVKGTARKDRDIDICLVSPDFGKDEIEELQFLLRQTRFVDDRIEPIPVSLHDYDINATPLIEEIKRYGKAVDIE